MENQYVFVYAYLYILNKWQYIYSSLQLFLEDQFLEDNNLLLSYSNENLDYPFH